VCISTLQVCLYNVHMSNLSKGRKGNDKQLWPCIHQLWPCTYQVWPCTYKLWPMHIPAVASVDDEPGAVTAGGYGIDPQREAALLAEV